MTTETNLQRTFRELREARERVKAEAANDPQQAAMVEALRVTPDEQAAIDAAQQAVADAEAAVNAAKFALSRAERGRVPVYDRSQPFSFFKKSRAAHKAAADAAVGGLRIDLSEAQSQLQAAIRRRNDVARRIELARMERRRAAKVKYSPAKPPLRRLNDGWTSPKGVAR